MALTNSSRPLWVSEAALDLTYDALVRLYQEDGAPPPTRVLAGATGLSTTYTTMALSILEDRGRLRRSKFRHGVLIPADARVVVESAGE